MFVLCFDGAYNVFIKSSEWTFDWAMDCTKDIVGCMIDSFVLKLVEALDVYPLIGMVCAWVICVLFKRGDFGCSLTPRMVLCDNINIQVHLDGGFVVVPQ